MYHHEPNEVRAMLRRADACEAFATWLAAEGDVVVDCAAWLGGPAWTARAVALCAAMRAGARPSRHRRRIKALAGLFALEALEDLGAPEAARFATLDLDDPHVHDCCRIAEELERGLRVLAARQVAARAGGRRAARAPASAYATGHRAT